MESSGKQSHEDARKQLLEEGTRSYLEAVTALIAYQQEVQSMCRVVMERGLDDYASALNLELSGDEIRDAASPSFATWKGDRWSLGVRIEKPNFTPEVRWWATHCYLEFEPGDRGLHCWVGEWYPNRKLAATLLEKFQRQESNVFSHDKTVWVEHRLTAEEVTSFDEHLEGLFQKWIGFWRNVGGFQSVFKG